MIIRVTADHCDAEKKVRGNEGVARISYTPTSANSDTAHTVSCEAVLRLEARAHDRPLEPRRWFK